MTRAFLFFAAVMVGCENWQPAMFVDDIIENKESCAKLGGEFFWRPTRGVRLVTYETQCVPRKDQQK